MHILPLSYTGTGQNHVTHLNESSTFYKAYFFGPFRVLRGKQPVGEPTWRRNKAKALLKWFLLNPDRMISAEQLLHLFWPNADSVTARNLHVTIHYLRHLLEPDLPPHKKSSFIQRNKNNFYWFEPGKSWWTDVVAMQHYLASVKAAEQQNDHAAMITYYNKIVAYCDRGFLPEDAYEDVFSPYRRQYEHIHEQALESLIQLCSQASMPGEALMYAHQALLLNPYCESAIQAIAQAHLQQGNRAGAIRRLDAFQHQLREEMGIEPGEEILRLRKSLPATYMSKKD